MFDKFSDEETKRLYYESMHPDSSGKTKVFNVEKPQPKKQLNLDKRLKHTESITGRKPIKQDNPSQEVQQYRQKLQQNKMKYDARSRQQTQEAPAFISIIIVFIL